jgi:fructose/tagatose bisphosphate aldolase
LQQCKWFIQKIARLHKEIADKISLVLPQGSAQCVGSDCRNTRSKIVLHLTSAGSRDTNHRRFEIHFGSFKLAFRSVYDRQCLAIGTSHGAYKFQHQPTSDVLAIDRIKAIHRRLPNTHLVMHGSSSVPQRLLEEIWCYGGDIRETYGVPVAEIREGIRHGVRKVNIDTDIRLAMTAAMRRAMKKNSHEFDPRKFLQAAMDETEKVLYRAF